MYTYVFQVEYNGGSYAGFQIQNNHPTIQQELELALKTILREQIRVHCCGRTDAGVHSTGQIVHFESEVIIDDFEVIRRSMNALLPDTIAIRQFSIVREKFHARFSCLAREYEYLIWNDSSRNALLPDRYLWHRKKLDVEDLNLEIASIVGEYDFASFTRQQDENISTKRYVDLASVRRIHDHISDSNNVVVVRIRANAFLHNMIRIIVGTLLDIHDGKLQKGLRDLILAKDRTLAGKTVSPAGLYFRHAWFPSTYQDLKWLKTMDSYPWMKSDRNLD